MARREITYTGPIYGARMRPATGEPGAIESDLLKSFELDLQAFARSRLDGSRRAARLFVDDLAVEAEGSGLRLRFSLPKGAFATTLLREMMKPGGEEPDPAPEIDEEA
jgi:tRNA pseudouridine13 synthase